MKRTLVFLILSSSSAAQVPLRGVAYDSLHMRPLAGAFVGIVGMSVTAISDSTGRFVLPGVPKGTHRVVMQHDVLDAIGLSAAGARAVVNNEGDSVVVATSNRIGADAAMIDRSRRAIRSLSSGGTSVQAP